MADRNSQIIMCKNIKLDRNYNNVLNYTEAQMLSLCRTNQVASASNYSFIRERGTIKTHFSYSQCLQSNYIAFQNPDYSNKWFFAWIDNVDYKSDGCGELSFTIDEWSTWFNKVNIADCFVVREHVNDDTIGLHTIPENLDIGTPICEEHEPGIDLLSGGIYIIVACNYDPSDDSRYAGMGQIGGVFTGVTWWAFKLEDYTDMQDLTNFIHDVDQRGHSADIQSIFAIPAKCLDTTKIQSNHFVKSSDFNSQINLKTYEIDKLLNFDDYTPRNNKLFCYPYNYLLATNNCGMTNIYKYEDWLDNATKCEFEEYRYATQGGSIKLVPRNYKGNTLFEDEGFSCGKYPQFAWTSDSFINWLTQNGVNIALQGLNTISGALLGTASNVATGNVAGLVSNTISSSSNIASIFNSINQASLQPNMTHGNTNNGDAMYQQGLLRFDFLKMRAKTEYLRIIDNYFDKFGYKVNIIKKPNITGRRYYNYIEIGGDEYVGFGEIPSKSLDTINNACRRGVSIWHNHANIGNYSLNNSII